MDGTHFSFDCAPAVRRSQNRPQVMTAAVVGGPNVLRCLLEMKMEFVENRVSEIFSSLLPFFFFLDDDLL
jgi:hypothetical protein